MNKSKCASMQPVEGGRPYCEEKQTVCDGKCPETHFQRVTASPERLAKWIQFLNCAVCPISKYCADTKDKIVTCGETWLDWLNAPAEED